VKSSFSDLFSEWRAADRAARDAEATAMERWEETGSIPRLDDQWKEAKRLRAFANYLMDAAIKEMKNEEAKRQSLSAASAPHDSDGDTGGEDGHGRQPSNK
jgi:hypothetical protein